MSPHQMLCHLADSYCAVIGEREVSLANPPLPRAILKWLVLRSPMRWPHNVPTRPELAQEGGGTPPLEFERDRRVLLNALERFCSVPDAQRTPHPILGELDRVEWLRWGYLHADHHLRQFGA